MRLRIAANVLDKTLVSFVIMFVVVVVYVCFAIGALVIVIGVALIIYFVIRQRSAPSHSAAISFISL